MAASQTANGGQDAVPEVGVGGIRPSSHRRSQSLYTGQAKPAETAHLDCRLGAMCHWLAKFVMLRSLNSFDCFSIVGSDGKIGQIEDILIEGAGWTVRYLVVVTSGWLIGRGVLLSPSLVEKTDWEEKRIHVRLSRRRIRDSPTIDWNAPTSLRHEMALFYYYSYPYYWTRALTWCAVPYPFPRSSNRKVNWHATDQAQCSPTEQDNHPLWSKKALITLTLEANGQKVGGIGDFLLNGNEPDWAIRFIAVDPEDAAPEMRIVLPGQIEGVSWERKTVFTRAMRSAAQAGAEPDEAQRPAIDHHACRR